MPATKLNEYDILRSYASTRRQIEILHELEKHDGNQHSVARSLDVNQSYISRTLKAVRNKAAKQGYSPDHDMTRRAPDGFKIKGVSSYYGRDGSLRGQWVKTSEDRDRQLQIMEEVIHSLTENLPALRTLPKPEQTGEDLMSVYTMTDSHMGMLAWGAETLGMDWDLDIAEKVLTGCFAAMLDAAPASKYGVVAQLGDFLHYDGLEAVTPTSGHILDADSRFEKLVIKAVNCLQRLVDMALAKHEIVYVLMAEGNHDMASSIWLRVLFEKLYRDEPRIRMIKSYNPYYSLQHGKTMLCWHHGHKKGLDASTGLMFAQHNPKMFGETEYRYIHFGDKHHWAGKEHPGFYMEQHPTLAPPDAYATRGGWVSMQRCTAITYSATYGEASRFNITPAMLGDLDQL